MKPKKPPALFPKPIAPFPKPPARPSVPKPKTFQAPKLGGVEDILREIQHFEHDLFATVTLPEEGHYGWASKPLPSGLSRTEGKWGYGYNMERAWII